VRRRTANVVEGTCFRQQDARNGQNLSRLGRSSLEPRAREAGHIRTTNENNASVTKL
jgi:hypothetical protein